MEKIHTDVGVWRVNFCKLLSIKVGYIRGRLTAALRDQVQNPGMVTISLICFT